jgi:hypothetical protein
MPSLYNRLVSLISDGKLTRTKKKKMLTLLSQPEKKRILFSAVTLEDCSIHLSLNTSHIFNSRVTLFIPDSVPHLEPSLHLCNQLNLLYTNGFQDPDKTHGMVFDAILLEILDSNINNKQFHGVCGKKLDWEGSDVVFKGPCDYMLLLRLIHSENSILAF